MSFFPCITESRIFTSYNSVLQCAKQRKKIFEMTLQHISNHPSFSLTLSTENGDFGAMKTNGFWKRSITLCCMLLHTTMNKISDFFFFLHIDPHLFLYKKKKELLLLYVMYIRIYISIVVIDILILLESFWCSLFYHKSNIFPRPRKLKILTSNDYRYYFIYYVLWCMWL